MEEDPAQAEDDGEELGVEMALNKIICGDVIEVLKTLDAESVHMVCCSPPYWGLRKYIEDDAPEKKHEIGLEKTDRYI